MRVEVKLLPLRTKVGSLELSQISKCMTCSYQFIYTMRRENNMDGGF